jgi:hypothetical protein
LSCDFLFVLHVASQFFGCCSACQSESHWLVLELSIAGTVRPQVGSSLWFRSSVIPFVHVVIFLFLGLSFGPQDLVFVHAAAARTNDSVLVQILIFPRVSLLLRSWFIQSDAKDLVPAPHLLMFLALLVRFLLRPGFSSGLELSVIRPVQDPVRLCSSVLHVFLWSSLLVL